MFFMNKKNIREKMLQIRNNIKKEVKNQKDEKITETFIGLLLKNNIKSVLLYASFGSEVDTWRIFQFCLENSIKTAFPKVMGTQLELYWVKDKEELFPGYKSIFEPKNGLKAFIEEIDVIAVPGIAFDYKCFRIGYGGGYYDRVLENKKGVAVGLAYEEQIIDEIPIEPHDKRLDLIITDERMISCV
ncbi:5-formyltetrahydrofolate cyclo-ligase [Thermodesulfovibrio yellowstonii]|uniref:5-formyltetrahydrofolate cyclo-ligase n=1 Tax=Thermodesulfovibrio yellowstonii TaxID=28262 RepID=UPI0030B7FD01